MEEVWGGSGEDGSAECHPWLVGVEVSTLQGEVENASWERWKVEGGSSRQFGARWTVECAHA